MAKIVSIKQKIEQLDSGSFQILCDAYLSREGYPKLVSLGTKAGTQKTTLGTPDTYFCEANGKYVLSEYTTQTTNLKDKIRSDLEKCFDPQKTGINNEDIAEIIYCHTSSIIDTGTDKELKQFCQGKGVQLTLIGIDALAEDIYRKYPILAKEHLGLNLDTEQIQTPTDFIKQYDANTLAAPLNTSFRFRDNDINRLWEAFDTNEVVILTGAAGAGKTRLAIEFAERYKEKKDAEVYIIHNHGLGIFEDLKLYFECPKDYFVVVDDANQLSELTLIVEYVNKKCDGYNVKILITVRNYALQKVKADICGLAHYSEIVIPPFSDEEIETLVKEQYGIINQDYLNRIATIAEGNARIAIIAGKVAVETNSMQSISDVTRIYSEYYGKAFRESNLEGNHQLQITAGVISFLGSIHLDYTEPILTILSKHNIDLAAFKDCAYILHEMELVDICHDKAVAITDQCFANYILQQVFVEKRAISLAEMLDTCFQTYRERTIQAVNTLLGVFRNQEVHDYTVSEIKTVWETRKSRSFSELWEWVKAFYPINQEEALLLLKKLIDNTEKVELSLESIDVDKGKNNVSVTDEIIAMLGGFADTSNIAVALDLFFEYYLRRPDLYIQFYHAVNVHFGIKHSSANTGFYTQIQLIQKFGEHSENWHNPFIRVLFVEIAKNFLQVQFSPIEAARRGHAFSVFHISLPATKQAISYRKLIWEQLLRIQEINNCKESIRSVLQDYPRFVEEISYGIVREDGPYICQLLQYSLSPESVLDCILVEKLAAAFEKASFISGEITKQYFNSRKAFIYHALCGTKRNCYDFSERESLQKNEIAEFYEQAGDCLASFDELYQVYCECVAQRVPDIYFVGTGFMYAVERLSHDARYFAPAAKAIVNNGILQGIDTRYICRVLFKLLQPKEVLEIILNAPADSVEYWRYSYFCEMPTSIIDNETLDNLYDLFRSGFNNTSTFVGNRSLEFLDRYKNVEPNVVVNVTKLIYAHREDAPLIANCYLSSLFNQYHFAPNIVLQMFADNRELLENVYLFVSTNALAVDFDGKYLVELCLVRKEYAWEYIRTVLDAKPNFIHEEHEKLHAIYEHPEFADIIDSVLEECQKRPLFFYDYHDLIKAFVYVPDDIKAKSDAWIRRFITKYNSDHKRMWFLFDVLAELPDDGKIEYISYLVNLNNDPALFREIPLTPSSYSWSGSAVPLYSGWRDYLEKLRSHFHGIRFLEHKKRINDVIEDLSKMIERAEIEDLLRG